MLSVPPIAAFVLPKTSMPPTQRTFLSASKSSSEQHQKQQDCSTEYSVLKREPKTEYAAIFPGSSVEIQVGDVNLARKAWKKRRRSGSPLLVPCSILSVDRKEMVRSSILYLLQKFGMPLDKEQRKQVGILGNYICLSISDIKEHSFFHLFSSLPVSMECRVCHIR